VTVAVVFTGGTIASRVDPASGAVVPSLRGAEVLAGAPEVADIAPLEAIDWGLVPASHLRFAQLIDICGLLDRVLARADVDGAVVVQGTDSIDETCLAFDLLVRSDKPVLVTGAMRNASTPDYDGPRNLADAVRCAADPALAGMGTLVVLDGRVLAADQAIKAHASALDAFQSRDGQPLGEVRDGRVAIWKRRQRVTLPTVPTAAAEPVYLLTVVTGMDGSLVRLTATGGAPPGLVIAGAGAGNMPEDMLAALVELMAAGTAVVLTTRCAAGAAQPDYGFPGGGAQSARAGAIISPLDGPKCRVALALGLGAGLAGDDLRRLLRA
jgi:L-asparaginase